MLFGRLFGRMYPGTAAGLGAIRGLTFLGGNDMVEAVSWDRPFAEPIELPEGKNCSPYAMRLSLHYQAAQGRTRRRRMAGSDADIATGSRT